MGDTNHHEMGCGASSQEPEEQKKDGKTAAAAEGGSAAAASGSDANGSDKKAPQDEAPAAAEEAPVVSDPANSPLMPVPGSADDHHQKPADEAPRAVDDSHAKTTELKEGELAQLDSKQVEAGDGSSTEAAGPASDDGTSAGTSAGWTGPESSKAQQRLQMDNKSADEVVARFEKALPAGAKGLTKIQFREVLPDMASTAPLLVDRLFGCFDSDKDGLVDKSEFMAVLASLCSGASESEKCRIVFGMYDSDGDGCVTKAELEEVLRAYFWSRTVVIEEMSVEEFDDFDEEPAPAPAPKAPAGLESKEILDEFVTEIFKGDVDGNQLLSFEEFEKWLLTARASNSLSANVMVKWVDVLVGGVKK